MPSDLVRRFLQIKHQQGLGSALQSTGSFILNRSPRKRFHQQVGARLFEWKNGSGIQVTKKDWDNLIILDACRYGLFEQYNTISGSLERVISKGSHSQEFFESNFGGKSMHDTIYVTANPYGAVIGENVFFSTSTTFSGGVRTNDNKPRIDTVVTSDDRELRHNHIENVDPEKVKETALIEHGNHPNKKAIIHFMQPHAPYLGEYAESLRKSLEQEHDIDFEYWMESPKSTTKTINSLLSAAKQGLISDEELKKVYTENLKIVLDHVGELVKHLNGKTVITADHGELLGEKRIKQYGHSRGLFVKELREVPWLVIESDHRRKIVSETPDQKSIIDESDVNQQLELLGYK